MELISGLAFHKLADWSFCERYAIKVKPPVFTTENDIVFINLDDFNECMNMLNTIRNPNKFILISHNSDKTFNHTHLNALKKYVNKIYAINNICEDPCVVTIPIGFRDWPIHTGPILQNILNQTAHLNKTNLVYMNFDITTNRKKRMECFNVFANKNWVTQESNVPMVNFYLKMLQSKYVLSPEGDGIDCHRIYESIYFNSIPILKTSQMDFFYKNWPVIIVNDWNEINENVLIENYEHHINKLKTWKENNIGWEFPEYWLNK